MDDIEQKLRPWSEDRRIVERAVHKRVLKHIDRAMLRAYQNATPSMKTPPPDVAKQERRKFKWIAEGDLRACFESPSPLAGEGLG